MLKTLATLIFLAFATTAFAEEIGKVTTKGWLAKDSLTIQAFNDPDIKGVTCYTTQHSRAFSFSDSSSTSISCRKTGHVVGPFTSRSNVFSTVKGWAKVTVVDRFWDAKRKVLVYLTYTKAGSGDNASHSISVVVVE